MQRKGNLNKVMDDVCAERVEGNRRARALHHLLRASCQRLFHHLQTLIKIYVKL